MDRNSGKNAAVAQTGTAENYSYDDDSISANNEHCFCCPCKFNMYGNKCSNECTYVHKNEMGFFICEHNRDIGDRNRDIGNRNRNSCRNHNHNWHARTKLKANYTDVQQKFVNLQHEYTELQQECKILQTRYTERDQVYNDLHRFHTGLCQEYIRQTDLLVQLQKENEHLRQQLNQPASSQPASSQPISNQPASNQPASNQQASNQPASNQPISNQPASNQPASNQPVSNQPVKTQQVSNQLIRMRRGGYGGL
jgi:phosphatidate phosphatase PAH1